MSDSKGTSSSEALRSSLLALADLIASNPPPIIGSDIFVQGAPGSSVVGSHISVGAGPSGSGIGQRIEVVARPGQTVIGQRITVVAGGGPAVPPPGGARSHEEISETVAQLREAAEALRASTVPQGWLKGLLKTAQSWGSTAINGACSGVAGAMASYFLGG